MAPILNARHIEVAFEELVVLDGVDLEIQQGEAVAVIGANGAGKTTLVRILAGVLEPNGGKICLLGEELNELSRREIARHIAVVPQGVPPVFAYTVLEFVTMGYHARSRGFLPTQQQIDGAKGALTALEMDDFFERSIDGLSGGELQRALMARAMVAKASVWLLDEPTASLDMHHQIGLLEQVRAHVDDGNAALAVLHDLALVHRFFDRVVVLHDGKIFAEGPPDEVLTEEVVSQIYGVPMQRGVIDEKVVWVAR